MLYEKETCHGCEKGFEPGDDTVVCPVCGTPQHRACWLERKACVNESLHADGFIWRAAVAQDEPKNPAGFDPKKDIGKICPNCGTNNPAGSKICAVCKKTIAEEEKQAVVPAEQPSAPATAAEMPAQPKPAKIPPFLAGISADEVISGVKALDIFLKARAFLTGYYGLPPVKRAIFRGLLKNPRFFDTVLGIASKFQGLFTKPVNDMLGSSCARVFSDLIGWMDAILKKETKIMILEEVENCST